MADKPVATIYLVGYDGHSLQLYDVSQASEQFPYNVQMCANDIERAAINEARARGCSPPQLLAWFARSTTPARVYAVLEEVLSLAPVEE